MYKLSATPVRVIILNTSQKYLKMKEAGVSENDPEFRKAHSILSALSQYQHYQKAQREQQQEKLARQRQNQASPNQNGATLTNGVNGNGCALFWYSILIVCLGSMVNGTSSTTSSTPDAPTTNTVTKASTAAQKHSQPVNASSFTQEQLNTLRVQILAFKMLGKGMPVPPNLQQQLRVSQQFKRPATREKEPATNIATPDEPVVTTAVKEEVEDGEQAPDRPWYSEYDDPWNLSSDSHRSHISYREHSRRHRRQRIPARMPAGVNVQKLREEREIAIYNRVRNRLQELENEPVNIALKDVLARDNSIDNDSLRLKARIEYKQLTLLAKQRELRKKVSMQMLHFDNLAQTANRSLYRRHKKVTMSEARTTEKLERDARSQRENKEKEKQKKQVAAIERKRQEILANAHFHKTTMRTLLVKGVQYQQQVEKEEIKRMERTAKQRLQALKNDDEATYLKLLGQAKDSRISHLLGQTDGFLRQLAASVREQQRNAVERYGGEDDELPDQDLGDTDDEDGPKVDYYEVAHRIKEGVERQADMLVGGTLKEYQLKGLQWMISLYNNNLNGILADEMGLGKTIQTISLITYLIEKKRQRGPYLVIVPLSTLTNWNLEFEKWAPTVNRIVYKGPPNARKTQQNHIRQGNFQVLLTTYEYIIKDRPILSKIKWLQMIVDEGHRMKNASSKLSSTITQYYHTRYRLILTGTPLQNNLPELWALLNFVLPNIFKSVKSFDEWFNTPFANTGNQDRIDLTEEEQLLVIRRLHKVLRPFLLRRLKKDVEKELPDKQERVIKCKFSALQAKLYTQMVQTQQLSVSDGKGGRTNMRGLTNMLMQLRKLLSSKK